MSTVRLHAGAELHNMSPDEFRGILREESAFQRAALRGVKLAYLPRAYRGTASGGVLLLGESLQFGPAEGQAWGLTRIVVNGLTPGATPDVVNMYFDDSLSQVQWQFNGNNFGYTFNPREMTMQPGQILFFQSTGTFAASGSISLAGQYWIMPAETTGRLIGH